MANSIPFDKLKVGETYYMQSAYWGKVLGTCKVAEISLSAGMGRVVDISWRPDLEPQNRTCCIEARDDYFWDSMPTKEEQENRREQEWKYPYVAPREVEGVLYPGDGIPEKWKEKLDDLIKKLEKTFQDDSIFKQDRHNHDEYFVWESKLDYSIQDFLVKNNGRCDWDSIQYLCKHGDYSIHAGEQDSFGWLTGVIEKEYPNGIIKSIIYG